MKVNISDPAEPDRGHRKKEDYLNGFDPLRDPKPTYRIFVTIGVAILLASCAAYGPYHANTSSEPLNSVRGPKDGRYKLAFIEFGDQGSALDTSQRTAALRVIHEGKRPLLFVYIHGWQNNANSGDVCRFEHFLDTVSQFPEVRAAKGNVIGVYIAWRGIDITLPVAKFLTFWSRKATGETIAAQNVQIAGISRLPAFEVIGSFGSRPRRHPNSTLVLDALRAKNH